MCFKAEFFLLVFGVILGTVCNKFSLKQGTCSLHESMYYDFSDIDNEIIFNSFSGHILLWH